VMLLSSLTVALWAVFGGGGGSPPPHASPFSSMNCTGRSQACRRVYPSSTTTVIHVCILVNKNSTKVSRYAAARSFLVSLKDVL
jgi:hypothetical protein